MCFPRLYAAASLKQLNHLKSGSVGPAFSAALCRGLIEADRKLSRAESWTTGFPRLYAAASLKQPEKGRASANDGIRFPRLYAAASLKRQLESDLGKTRTRVFRGSMPRPH